MTTSLYPALHARWLIDSDKDDTISILSSVGALQRHDIPLPPDVGHGWVERLLLADGMSLLHGVHCFRPEASGQLVPLGEFKIEFPVATFGTQTIQGGIACHREFHPPAELIFKPGYDFFRHANGFHTIPSLDSSSDSEMTSLIIADGVLAELLGEDVARQLIERLGLGALPTVKVIPIPLLVSAPLRSSVSPTLLGQLKILFAQAKVLEYLCGLAGHVCIQPTKEPRMDRKRDAMRELHDHLIQMEGKLPTLDELAVRCGISARWLNDAFTQEYGQTIFSFITGHRLAEAHAALLEGNLPIKTISARMGYSHVNHFTIAFKKKFGYPPGSLRQGRLVEDI